MSQTGVGVRVPGPVTFETMVAYVDGQVGRVLAAIDNLSREFDRHQDWHRGALEQQIANNRAGGWSWAGLIVQIASTFAAIAAVVVAVVALTH